MPVPEKRSAAKKQEGGTPWFGSLNQSDFELDFFEAVLRRNAKSVAVLRCLGELLARKGLYERSLELDQQLVTLLPDDGVARYNLACSLAMVGSKQKAIEELARAIEQGYDDFHHIEIDPDLDGLRDEPAFDALLRRFSVRPEPTG